MVVEANRDAARQCVERARTNLFGGNKAEAQRWMHKAKKLDPDCDLSSLLHSQHSDDAGEEQQANGHVPPTGDGDADGGESFYAHDDHYEEAEGLRSRHQRPTKAKSGDRSRPEQPSSSQSQQQQRNKSRSKSGPRTSAAHNRAASKEKVTYTKEEVEWVERIRHCKDYYEILQVDRQSFDEGQLKKRYYAIALKLHPDKCKAPGATEAFKAVGNAYTVLADQRKREDYDRYGADGSNNVRRRHSSGRDDFYEYDVNRGFEAEMSPEDIFDMFFGAGFGAGRAGNVRFRQRQRTQFNFHRPHAEGAPREEGILPILVIIIGGLLVQLFSGDPAYSLAREGHYVHQRYTHDLRVPYFVKADFEQHYGKRLRQVEQHVEDDYLTMLRTNCYREKNHRDSLLWTAKLRGDSDLWRRAQETELVYCKKLEEVYR